MEMLKTMKTDYGEIDVENDKNEGMRLKLMLVIEKLIMDTFHKRTVTCLRPPLSNSIYSKDFDKLHRNLKISNKRAKVDD